MPIFPIVCTKDSLTSQCIADKLLITWLNNRFLPSVIHISCQPQSQQLVSLYSWNCVFCIEYIYIQHDLPSEHIHIVNSEYWSPPDWHPLFTVTVCILYHLDLFFIIFTSLSFLSISSTMLFWQTLTPALLPCWTYFFVFCPISCPHFYLAKKKNKITSTFSVLESSLKTHTSFVETAQLLMPTLVFNCFPHVMHHSTQLRLSLGLCPWRWWLSRLRIIMCFSVIVDAHAAFKLQPFVQET